MAGHTPPKLEPAAELHKPPKQWSRVGEVCEKGVRAGVVLAHDALNTVVAEEPVVLERSGSSRTVAKASAASCLNWLVASGEMLGKVALT